MKKSNPLLFALIMLSHVLFAFETDWGNGTFNDNEGPETPPAPIDNVYFVALIVAVICCYLVLKSRKNREQC